MTETCSYVQIPQRADGWCKSVFLTFAVPLLNRMAEGVSKPFPGHARYASLEAAWLLAAKKGGTA